MGQQVVEHRCNGTTGSSARHTMESQHIAANCNSHPATHIQYAIALKNAAAAVYSQIMNAGPERCHWLWEVVQAVTPAMSIIQLVTWLFERGCSTND